MEKIKIAAQVQRDLKKAGATDGQLRYAREVLSPLGYTDPKYDGSWNRSEHQLENLNVLVNLAQTIEDERFQELLESTIDAMPIIAEHHLTHEQISKLSPAEKQQYRDIRAQLYSEQKATISHGQTNFEIQMENEGLKSDEESNKKSTIIPPKGVWGVSDTYYYIKGVAERFDTISKYLQDIAKQVYVFKLEKELDKEVLALLESYHDERMLPIWELSLLGSEEIINILENIQDEKNRDTALGWMKKGMDKHWNYGNHGAGEVDYIQTGEYIFRLGKKENVVVRVPIKREFTREQVGDKTTVKLLDQTNQIHIHCPNQFDIYCSKCNNNTFHRLVEIDEYDPETKKNRIIKEGWDKHCNLDFNKQIVPDEERDMFAGDLFYKATNILLENKLSQAAELICDNAIFIEHRTPNQWFKEKTGKDVKDLIVLEQKPEKIKTENLDPSDRAIVGYNIFWGRAHRTADKSEHFSNEA